MSGLWTLALFAGQPDPDAWEFGDGTPVDLGSAVVETNAVLELLTVALGQSKLKVDRLTRALAAERAEHDVTFGRLQAEAADHASALEQVAERTRERDDLRRDFCERKGPAIWGDRVTVQEVARGRGWTDLYPEEPQP